MALLAYRSLQIGHSTRPEEDDDDGVLLTEDEDGGPALFAAGSELLGLVLAPPAAAADDDDEADAPFPGFSGGRCTSSISGPTPHVPLP